MTDPIPFHSTSWSPAAHTYLQQALAGQQSADGPFGRACEAWLQRLTGRTALLTNSCSSALEMAAVLANIKAGDEVIMPSFTFPSTATAFVKCGATPVFVDIRADTLNMDESLIEAAISPRTRALVPVHYAGVGCELDAMRALCDQYALLLIEDAAQGVMSRYGQPPLGSFGDFATFSFHSTKNISCGEGGALLIKDLSVLETAWQLRDKGTNRMAFLRGDVPHYQWVRAGSSYGLSDINAALLLAQLETAESLTAERLTRWNVYHGMLAEAEQKGLLRRPAPPAATQHNAHTYYVLLQHRQQRDSVQRKLQQAGIHACSHYEPLHTSPAGRQFGRASGNLSVTEAASACLLRLPLWSHITPAQQQRVVASLLGSL